MVNVNSKWQQRVDGVYSPEYLVAWRVQAQLKMAMGEEADGLGWEGDAIRHGGVIGVCS